MSQILEHIREEVKALPPAERFLLWRDLGKEFESPLEDETDETLIESEWDEVVETRMREVEAGLVELVPAEDVVRRIRQSLAERRREGGSGA